VTQTIPTDTDYPLDQLGEQGESDLVQMDLDEDQVWLDLASNNYTTARSYQDAALTTQWERNADHFNNKHYRRSVYNSKQYRGRSRLFRPLSRAAERSSSAQAAAAYFSNLKMVAVTPGNTNDPEQVAAAHIMEEVLEYRLSKSIKWYLTVLGAWQDTRVYGPCCTHTSWDYEEKTIKYTKKTEVQVKDVLGNPIEGRFTTESEEVEETRVLKDEPVISMIPPENLLLDPQCDWRDPIGTSPYVVRLVPMSLDDIRARMESTDTKTTTQKWRTYSTADILSVGSDTYNTVRQAREGDNRPDPTDSQNRTEFKVIWVHENYIRVGGEEYVYWTLGTQRLLTSPEPLKDVYHTGTRPLTYGFSIVEAHRFSPSSATELIAGLQVGVNDVANLRFDNIKLALNKRYIIRRGAAVDLEALMMSVPGGGVTTDDPDRDIKVLDTRDVTGSSYREQERLETESNDISGTFMGGSVQNNRSLNETVGGMEMLAEGANVISEFDLRTFTETWVKPQLELLIQFIQAYETDEVVMNNAFEASANTLGIKYNQDPEEEAPAGKKTFSKDETQKIKDRVLNDKLTINVNVGLGATSPQKKVDMFGYVLKSFESMPEQLQRLDGDEIAKEMWSAAGFQDGARFLKGNKPGEEEKPLTEQDIQQAYEQGAAESQDQSKMRAVEVTQEIGMAKIEMEREVRLADIAMREGITVQQLEAKAGIESQKDRTRRDIAASAAKSKSDEMALKERTGKPGI